MNSVRNSSISGRRFRRLAHINVAFDIHCSPCYTLYTTENQCTFRHSFCYSTFLTGVPALISPAQYREYDTDLKQLWKIPESISMGIFRDHLRINIFF